MNSTCDRCPAIAYVTTELDTGLSLTWCAHHFAEHADALLAYTVRTIDMRHLLTQGAR